MIILNLGKFHDILQLFKIKKMLSLKLLNLMNT